MATSEVADVPMAMKRFGGWRRETRAFLELFAVTGIAIVQPLFDSLRRNSYDFFVASGASRSQIVLLVATILLVPPTALWLIEVVVGLVSARVRVYAHATLGGLVVGTIVMEVLVHQVGLSNAPSLLVAVPFAVGGALLILRVDLARTFLRYLTIGPIIFTVLFVSSKQVEPLVLTAREPATANVEIAKPNRVVMIVMDELPLESLLDGSGHVDAGLYPNIAKFAAGSTWYRNTTTVAPYTSVAVPSLLTGDYPTDPKAIPTASVFPHNLFTLLKPTYSINAHENTEQLNPTSESPRQESFGWLLDKSVERWRAFAWPPSGLTADASLQADIAPETLTRELASGREFVDSLNDSPDKQFDYLHVLLPHVPWHLLPDGRSYTDSAALPGLGAVWSDAALAGVARQRHLLQLQATDRLIGEIVDRLKERGAYDRSMIVLTADHGQGFTAGNPSRKATKQNFTEIMWIPLFIKAAGQTTGTVDDRPAESIDLLPTMSEMLGAKLPWKIDGKSLLGPARPDGPRRLLDIPASQEFSLPEDPIYKEWDGPAGFAEVLKARAAAPGGAEDLRIYRGTSKFGDLVGRPVAPVVDPAAAPIEGEFNDPSVFRNVDPHAGKLPWTYVDGHLPGKGGELAITVNGVIASIATTVHDAFRGGSGYFVVLPPSLFRAGSNDVRAYLIKGPPSAPRLTAVTGTPTG